MAITPKQKAVFDYIKSYIDENSFSPTFEEIAHHFAYKSKGTVYKHIKALKLKGLLRQEWNRVRSIQLASRRKNTASLLPLKGEWTTRGLRWAKAPYIYMGIPPEIAHNNNSYIITVTTRDLLDKHTIQGDTLVVQPNISQHVSGSIIIEQRTRPVLREPTWKRYPNQIIGQIAGVYRQY